MRAATAVARCAQDPKAFYASLAYPGWTHSVLSRIAKILQKHGIRIMFDDNDIERAEETGMLWVQQKLSYELITLVAMEMNCTYGSGRMMVTANGRVVFTP